MTTKTNQELAEEYLAFLEGTGISTRSMMFYGGFIRTIAQASKSLLEMGPEDVKGLLPKTVSPSTYHGLWLQLQRFYKWCVAQGYLEATPTIFSPLPSNGTVVKPYTKPLDISHLPLFSRTTTALLIYNGIRLPECARLTFGDLVQKDIPNYPYQVSVHRGDADTTTHSFQLPVHPLVVELLALHTKELRSQWGDPTADSAVFRTKDGHPYIPRKMVTIGRRRLQSQNISPNLRQLHATFAYNLLIQPDCETEDIIDLAYLLQFASPYSFSMWVKGIKNGWEGVLSKQTLSKLEKGLGSIYTVWGSTWPRAPKWDVLGRFIWNIPESAAPIW